MRLIHGTDWLEIDAAQPVDPDVLLNVSFHVSGFSGADQSWVARRDWDGFLADLCALEASRRGAALLAGANPEEFQLRFYTYDSVGHTAVDGMLARKNGGSLGEFGARIEFGMPFEPDQLLSVLREFQGYTQPQT